MLVRKLLPAAVIVVANRPVLLTAQVNVSINILMAQNVEQNVVVVKLFAINI